MSGFPTCVENIGGALQNLMGGLSQYRGDREGLKMTFLKCS